METRFEEPIRMFSDSKCEKSIQEENQKDLIEKSINLVTSKKFPMANVDKKCLSRQKSKQKSQSKKKAKINSTNTILRTLTEQRKSSHRFPSPTEKKLTQMKETLKQKSTSISKLRKKTKALESQLKTSKTEATHSKNTSKAKLQKLHCSLQKQKLNASLHKEKWNKSKSLLESKTETIKSLKSKCKQLEKLVKNLKEENRVVQQSWEEERKQFLDKIEELEKRSGGKRSGGDERGLRSEPGIEGRDKSEMRVERSCVMGAEGKTIDILEKDNEILARKYELSQLHNKTLESELKLMISQNSTYRPSKEYDMNWSNSSFRNSSEFTSHRAPFATYTTSPNHSYERGNISRYNTISYDPHENKENTNQINIPNYHAVKPDTSLNNLKKSTNELQYMIQDIKNLPSQRLVHSHSLSSTYAEKSQPRPVTSHMPSGHPRSRDPLQRDYRSFIHNIPKRTGSNYRLG
ncbi:unnamed protein product [Moneuplotes crassus]|uniref:Uncharacterized protein n=1 Tax=Euplotes crassus TaxID=5936 RepID=A0AAD1U4I0_EUPCR|nr:unnamed protein product [Moneuplotes crassus]